MPRHIPLFTAIILLLFLPAFPAENTGPTPSEIDRFVEWWLHSSHDLEEIPFPSLILTATGKQVLPVDRNDPETSRVLNLIGHEATLLINDLNQPGHPIHSITRINEVSGKIEDFLQIRLNEIDGFLCDFPKTASGKTQRSGYPDLRLTDTKTGRVYYIDPKLHAAGSEKSSFRTFYYQPRTTTNKILDDATHLILGIAHNGRQPDGRWYFLHWKLIDLSSLRVQLKAEFQTGNRGLYRQEAVVAESENTPATP